MLNLPLPDHTPLEHLSLPLVVAQARFAAPMQEISQQVVADAQARLRQGGVDLPRVTPVSIGDIVLGPGAPVASVSVSGFQLTAEDGAWLVTLTSDSVAVETPAFRSFADQFGPRLAQVISAATQAVQPVTLTRAGLRFVNLLRRPPGTDPEGWARWIRPSLVAAHSDELLGPGLLSQSQQLLFEVAPGIRATVRTGLAQVEGEEAFVLDVDTYAEPLHLWTEGEVVGLFERLNGCGVALFQSLVSPEMLAHLKLADKVEGGDGYA